MPEEKNSELPEPPKSSENNKKKKKIRKKATASSTPPENAGKYTFSCGRTSSHI